MKRRLALVGVLLGVLGLFGLGSCSWLGPLLASNREFVPLAGSTVAYEAGAEVLARDLAAALPAAMQQVADQHGAPFRRSPPIYICASAECYRRHTNLPERARGGHLAGSIYLSPRLVREPQTARDLLVHELSHAHLYQHRGWRYHALPHWYQEGLAVLVSGGAGAEECSEQRAVALIRAGRHFQPLEKGGLLARRDFAYYGLQPHEFYRQGAVFVGWMRSHDGKAFLRMQEQVLAGRDLEEAFVGAYGFDLHEGWQRMLRVLPPL